MEKLDVKIKYNSIFYRSVLLMLSFFIMVFYVIADGEGKSIVFFNNKFSIGIVQSIYIQIVIFIVLSVILHFAAWKFYICKEGIYLKKIDLFIPWEEISDISHVWINEFKSLQAGRSMFYNRKTLVIYRKEYKPICIYNVSVSALYAIKFYCPGIETNVISATSAAVFDMALNIWILYEGYVHHFNNMKFEFFMILIGLYAIKVFAVPLIMVKHQNSLHGEYLFHDTAYKKNPSKTIHL